jgi:AcrR family transcriptional regulator
MSRYPAATSTDGLRERKKARTRATLQQVALRLFREQGYEQTTVEQIAATAEVSVSTFFRYFPAKEDVVLYDALDPLFAEAFRTQPPELTAVDAMRAAVHDVFGTMSHAEVEEQRERAALAMSVPSLQNAWIGELVRTVGFMTSMLAERVGADPDDLEVRVTAGAVMGALLALLFPAVYEQEFADDGGFVTATDVALDVVAAGFPLLQVAGAAPGTPQDATSTSRG